MTGSGMNIQSLLPAKTGEAVQRGVSLRRSDQTFAAVFEKKIQVRQEQRSQSPASTETANRPVNKQDHQEDAKSVKKTEKSERASKANPAKEKLKELMKKAKSVLEAMKDPDATLDQLKALAKTLQDTLGEIKVLVEAMETQTPGSDSAAADNPELMQLLESMGSTKAPVANEQNHSESTEANGRAAVDHGIQHKQEHWDNRQAPELKGNPILKDLEKVIEAQADLLASEEGAGLKETLRQVLTEIKAIQDIEVTKPDVQFGEKLDALLTKLNGMVVKAPEIKPTEETASPDTAEASDTESAEGLKSESSVQADVTKTGAQGQEPSGDDQHQQDFSQGRQLFQAEAREDTQDSDSVNQGKASAVKPAETAEVHNAVPKATTQAPQSVQNPQAFQDTLDAIKEGVQAKSQFQSRIMEQVVETIKMNVRSDDGKSEMIMKLKPESLGNVALKVSIEKGIVLAELQVDSQAVKQALEANLQDLKNALQDKGFNVFDLDVSVRKDNQQQQNSGNSQGFKNRSARLEATVERMEQRLMSLESAHRESTIDYLG